MESYGSGMPDVSFLFHNLAVVSAYPMCSYILLLNFLREPRNLEDKLNLCYIVTAVYQDSITPLHQGYTLLIPRSWVKPSAQIDLMAYVI